jgi:Ca-activated chloride channel family protein
MKNKDLKRLLNGLPVPKPDEEVKSRTIRTVMTEFRSQAEVSKEKVKGSSWLGRLMGKLLKGGPIMQKQITMAATLAAGCIALAIFLSPSFLSHRNEGPKPSGSQVTTAQRDQVETARPSNQAGQPPVLEEITVTAAKRSPGLPPESMGASQENEYILSEVVSDAERKISSRQSLASPAPVARRLADDATLARPVDQSYVGRDKFDTITTNPVKLVSEAPVSTFSIDVDTAAYAFVRRALNGGYLPQTNAVRIEEMINYFDYDYPLPGDRSVPFKPTVALFPTPWNADTKLLHIGIKGYDIVPV